MSSVTTTSCSVDISQGRKKCRVCKQKIDKGAIEIGMFTKKNASTNSHLECFKVPHNFTNNTQLVGLDKLNTDDQAKVNTYIHDETHRLKAPRELLTQKQMLNDNEKKALTISKAFFKKFNIKQLQQMLSANGLSISGNKSTLADRVALGIVLGAPPKCPKCTVNPLDLENGAYICMPTDEQASCGFTILPNSITDQITMHTWKWQATEEIPDKELADKVISDYEKLDPATSKSHEISLEVPDAKKPKVQ